MDRIGSDNNYPKDNFGPQDNSAGFIQPYKVGSGVMRGTQIISNNDNSSITLGKIPSSTDFGIQLNAPNKASSITLDSTSNALYVTGADGSKIGIGEIPDGSGDFGLFELDASGFLLYKIVGGVQNWYDKNNNTNTGRAGLLPDGNYGWVFVPPNNNVIDAFV